MRPKLYNDIEFLCESLESIDYTRYNTGTAQPKLNQDRCRNIELMLPCYDEQIAISKFLRLIKRKITVEQCKIDQLTVIKNGLLQKMFI
jgi:type I restriction enzyme S subunit